MKNRNLVNNDNWATPKKLYDELNKEFNFDFDPCPWNDGEITDENDGLLIPWGNRNFINPPYSRKLKEEFVKRALSHSRDGKLCVMLLPVSTSTKLFHKYIQPFAKEIRFLEGRVKFSGINTRGEYVNWHNTDMEAPPNEIHVKNSGMHDSMIVVFGDNKLKNHLSIK